jgi:GAF domain-containing protein
VAGTAESSASLAVPIKVRGHTIGVIDAHKPDGAGEWTAEEAALMETLADQLGVALENARLYQDSQHRAERERLMGEVTARMRESLDLEAVLKTAAQEVRQALGLPKVTVRLAPGGPGRWRRPQRRRGDARMNVSSANQTPLASPHNTSYEVK